MEGKPWWKVHALKAVIFVALLTLSSGLLILIQSSHESRAVLTTSLMGSNLPDVPVQVTGPDALVEAIKSTHQPSQDGPVERYNLARENSHITLVKDDETVASRRVGDWASVLAPLIAVLLALLYRNIVLGLFAGVWLGATVLAGGNPFLGLWDALRTHIVGSVLDSFNLYIIGFTLALVGMVQLIIRIGGVQGILEKFHRVATSARATRVATWGMGLVIFFDDYANTIVAGSTMRPMTDRLKISREKLAYIVDSTAAPIAGVAVISTWIGYEVGLFDELSRQLGLGRSGYDIFFSIILFRFYCLFTLFFVFLVALFGRDYGPMRVAESRAHYTGALTRPGSRPMTSGTYVRVEAKEGIAYRWQNAVLPVALVVACTMLGMFWSGWERETAVIPHLWEGPGAVLAAWKVALPDLASFQAWRQAFGNADSAYVLFIAAMLGSLITFALGFGQRLVDVRDALKTYIGSVRAMWLAISILILAWAIRSVCDDLGTSIYLVSVVEGLLSPRYLPIVTFLLSAVVAFATGTSWGTMGIMLPTMIPMAYLMTGGQEWLILGLCFAAVLDGAIFGDHCSPLSDTTVMSSISAQCDHVDHVKTQLPYALTTMAVSSVFGYVGVAFGLPLIAAFLLSFSSLGFILFIFGRDPRMSGYSQDEHEHAYEEES